MALVAFFFFLENSNSNGFGNFALCIYLFIITNR